MNIAKRVNETSPVKPACRTRNSILLVVGLCLGSVSYLRACTVFSDSSEGTALAGRNYDGIADGQALMWFVPASKGAHGRVCFGRYAADCEDGMDVQDWGHILTFNI
jgi:hypothetical protein